MKDLMQDVVSSQIIRHPDPRLAGVNVSIQIPATFWERLGRHLQRAAADASEMALWNKWFTEAGVRAILDVTSRLSNRIRHADQLTAIPESASGILLQAVADSLEYPLALRVEAGYSRRFDVPLASPLYVMILDNGATLTMRIPQVSRETTEQVLPATIEDCFFSRAAIDLDGLDLADARGSLGGTIRLRWAVARHTVIRYASLARDAKHSGLVPPDRPCVLNEDARAAEVPVSFLNPTAWGFSGGGNGCYWIGLELLRTPQLDDGTRLPVLRHLLSTVSIKSNRNDTDRSGSGMMSRDHLVEAGLIMPRSRGEEDNYLSPAMFSPSVSYSLPHRQNESLDSFFLLPELDHAMQSLAHAPSCSSQQSPRDLEAKAYQSATALGRCRLFGIDRPDQTEFTLAPDVASHAAAALTRKLRRWVRDAANLPLSLDGATSARASELCLSLLEARMEAWAAWIAIDECYSAAVDGADISADHLSQQVDEVLIQLQEFDDAMQWAEPLLAAPSAAGVHLLDNWKSLLALPYRQSPPWWLDMTSPAFCE